MTAYLLFDFFGTLVDYSRERHDPTYPGTREALKRVGVELGPQELPKRWQAMWRRFEERSTADHREFSLLEVGQEFLREQLGHEPDGEQTRAVMDVYLREWNSGVRPLDGIAQWLRGLAKDYRLAIVSNTNDSFLVPNHVLKMGLENVFDALILSVEVGWRKPHPEIYAHALQKLGAQADQAVFVGDTFDCDFDGPTQAGMRAFLIDPHDTWALPTESRLDSVFELSSRLNS